MGEGDNRRDRLFLWYLAYRLPSGYPLTPELLQQSCQRCRYPYGRILEIQSDYPQAWARMLIKRAYRHTGIFDPQVSKDQIEAARRADIMCHHPRMANIMALPFYGVIYSEPLRTRTAPSFRLSP